MPDPAPLPETMSYLLAQVCKLHWQRTDDLLTEIRLNVGQEMVLCTLWEREVVIQTELGEHLAVRPATVTNALRRLERKRLVQRIPDAEDQRVSRVLLAREGRLMRAKVEEKWDRLKQVSFAGITARERDLLQRLLSSVRDNLAAEPLRRVQSTAGPTQQLMENQQAAEQGVWRGAQPICRA